MEQTEDNDEIIFQNSDVYVKYDGVHFGNMVVKTNENYRIDTFLSEFNRRLNVSLTTFNHAHTYIKYILFKSYCMPSYGSKIWNFISRPTSCTRFITNCYEAVRRILDLPVIVYLLWNSWRYANLY